MNANAIWMPLRFTMVSMEKCTANTAMRSILDISKSPATKAGWTSKLLWARKANATLVRDVPERYFVFFYMARIFYPIWIFYRFSRLNELLHVLETTIKIVSVVLNVTKNWIRRLAVKVIGNDPNRRIFSKGTVTSKLANLFQVLTPKFIVSLVTLSSSVQKQEPNQKEKPPWPQGRAGLRRNANPVILVPLTFLTRLALILFVQFVQC